MLSGVNRGQNIAEDVTMSGTVAGAIEGMALGVPSIALSQAVHNFDDAYRAMFETAEAFGPGVIRRLIEVGWPAEVVMNINGIPEPSRLADVVVAHLTLKIEEKQKILEIVDTAERLNTLEHGCLRSKNLRPGRRTEVAIGPRVEHLASPGGSVRQCDVGHELLPHRLRR